MKKTEWRFTGLPGSKPLCTSARPKSFSQNK